ncbi:hypothetical protein HRbin30_03290 [bacterium HR30]|nr:hypothetical protein HRbin30_03290 [bacterium HR30]
MSLRLCCRRWHGGYFTVPLCKAAACGSAIRQMGKIRLIRTVLRR